MGVPKRVNTGGNRTVVGHQVLNAQDDLVQREQLNRILKQNEERVSALQRQVDNLSTGGGGETPSGDYELSADPTHFSLDNIEGNSWYLDLVPGGIGTTELADEAVTTAKLADLADSGTGTLLAITRDSKGRISGSRATIPSDFPPPTINTTPGDFIVPEWDSGTSTLTANLRANTFFLPISGAIVDFINRGDLGAMQVFVDPASSLSVTSITDGENGALFILGNDRTSSGDVTILNAAGAFLSERIFTPDGSDYVITPGNSVTLRYVYDATLADPGYWVFEAVTTAGGGGGGGVVSVTGDWGVEVDNTDPLNPVVRSAAYGDMAAGEDLSAGDFVFVFDDSVPAVLLATADSLTQRPASGFVRASYLTDDIVRVYFQGQVLGGLSGLSPGTDYYLSTTTPGGFTATPPTAVGDILQRVGYAVSSTEMLVTLDPPVIISNDVVVSSVGAGAGVSVDNSDPENPVVSISPSFRVRSLGAGFTAEPAEVASGSFKQTQFPCNGTIVGWRISANSVGSATFGITVNGVSIVAAAPPTIIGNDFTASTTLTGWTTSHSKGDEVRFTITSTAAFQNVEVILDIQQTS